MFGDRRRHRRLWSPDQYFVIEEAVEQLHGTQVTQALVDSNFRPMPVFRHSSQLEVIEKLRTGRKVDVVG
jgi:hypothetical protein